MTLGNLIARLEKCDPARVVPRGFARPHSYRGYYHELAFEPTGPITVGEMLEAAKSALGATYQGYKGGDYEMGEHTDCWISEEGCVSNEPISDLLLDYLLAENQSTLYEAVGTKRHLEFVRPDGVLGVALGIPPTRAAELEDAVNDCIEKGMNLRQVIETMNERGDMTGAEWTNFCYTLGGFQASRGIGQW